MAITPARTGSIISMRNGISQGQIRSKEASVFLKAKPKTIEEDCDHCGACAAHCPVEAIDFNDETKVPGTCIKCQACVKVCHTNAKYFDDEKFLSHVKMLEENYTRRAKPQFFIGAKEKVYGNT